MRFIENIEAVKLNKLKKIYKKDEDPRQRQRAHSIILSTKGFSIDQISNIMDVDRDSVSSWFNKWEDAAVEGLSDLPREGRPPMLFNDLKKN